MSTYTFHITFYDLTLVGLIFIGLTFAFQLWTTKNGNRPANRLLALTLLTIVLWMAWVLGIDIRLDNYFSRWSWLPMQFSLALGPLLYLYVLKLTRPESKFSWKGLLHFGPLLLQQGVLALAIGESMRTGAATYDTLLFRQTYWLLQLAACISVITYLYWCLGLIERFYLRSQFNSVSDRYRYELRWLRNLLNGFGLLWMLWIPFTVYYRSGPDVHAYPPFYILLAVITIRIAAIAQARPGISPLPVTPAFVKLPLPAEARQKGSWLKKVVKTNLYYQDPDLSLTSLAEKLELTPHELSRILNTVLKKSFVDFIGEFRVIEVARKLQDPAYDHITLLGIAYSAGFNSKTTFHRTFRQIAGKSPAEYKNDLKKVSPVYKLELEPHFAQVISSQQSTFKWSEQKLNRNYMFKNYLKIAWRNLIKNKTHSLINIVGLSVGMAVAMLIGLWIWDELSFNTNHKNYDTIARVMQNSKGSNGDIGTQSNLPFIMGDALRAKYGSDFKHVVMSTNTDNHVLTYGDKKLKQYGNYMEPGAPEMLTLQMVSGSYSGLKDPASIMLSQSAARAIFGNDAPMDKLIKIDNRLNAKVTGVYADIPGDSEFKDVAFIAPFELYLQSAPWLRARNDPWDWNGWYCYVQMAVNADMNKVSQQIKDIKQNASSPDGKKFHWQIFLDPMKNWHLYGEFKNGVHTGGLIEFVWLSGIIGSFVLLLACINFMNLSTARSEKRAKEVGIRKAIGSVRSQLIKQFFSESLMMAFFAFLFALILVQLALPAFNQVAGKAIVILWNNPVFWIAGICFTLFTGIIAGSYPAFYLSSFKPVKVLKGTFKVGRLAALPRKVLVVVQFTVSVILIIGTIVVFRQIQFAKNRPAGYNRNGLVMVQMLTKDIHLNFDAIKTELQNAGAIVEMAETGSPVTEVWSTNGDIAWKGKDPSQVVDFPNTAVSVDYGKTAGWKFVNGRDFSRDFRTDTAAFIVNEAAVKYMGLKNPVGETLTWGGHPLKIIGVVKNVITESPYQPVPASLYHLSNHANNFILLRLNQSKSTHQSIEKVASVFNKYNPSIPFDYKFADDEYAKKFGDEERIGKLASFFATLTVLISCLGLFGMASFMAEQRIKEIGVRKVLGATVFNLWQLLSKDFVVMVIISLLIASPVAYYFMHKWLLNYQYHTEITWWVFAAAASGALLLTMLTVSYQSIKAALASPVKSLKSE